MAEGPAGAASPGTSPRRGQREAGAAAGCADHVERAAEQGQAFANAEQAQAGAARRGPGPHGNRVEAHPLVGHDQPHGVLGGQGQRHRRMRDVCVFHHVEEQFAERGEDQGAHVPPLGVGLFVAAQFDGESVLLRHPPAQPPHGRRQAAFMEHGCEQLHAQRPGRGHRFVDVDAHGLHGLAVTTVAVHLAGQAIELEASGEEQLLQVVVQRARQLFPRVLFGQRQFRRQPAQLPAALFQLRRAFLQRGMTARQLELRPLARGDVEGQAGHPHGVSGRVTLDPGHGVVPQQTTVHIAQTVFHVQCGRAVPVADRLEAGADVGLVGGLDARQQPLDRERLARRHAEAGADSSVGVDLVGGDVPGEGAGGGGVQGEPQLLLAVPQRLGLPGLVVAALAGRLLGGDELRGIGERHHRASAFQPHGRQIQMSRGRAGARGNPPASAEAGSGWAERREHARQVVVERLEQLEQVGERRPRIERHQQLRGQRVEHQDGAAGRDLDDADRTQVEEAQQVFGGGGRAGPAIWGHGLTRGGSRRGTCAARRAGAAAATARATVPSST